MVVESLPLGSIHLLFGGYFLVRIDCLVHTSTCLEGID